MVAVDTQSVKVYTVNGAAIGSASSLPDWLVRKRAAKAKGKRAIRERVEGSIELIQHFEFPEASNRIKTTRDGHHVIATGTYKPQMRVWDLDQLALKFERHADIENIDFIVSFSRTLLSPTSEAVTMAFFLLLLVSHTKPSNIHTLHFTDPL
jgi:ribosome biogenesis protein ENP2